MKYRVIVNGVSFYTTARQINLGVGSDSGINVAVQQVKKAMGKSKGLLTSVRVYNSEMKSIEYSIHLSRL